MNKLALNFICKNEEHVIERMLNSSGGIYDLVVAVDTGSTDRTIELIEKWGVDNKTPTYVFQRPFDTFDKSRNYAMDKLREVAKEELKWDLDKTHGSWYDCDEELIVNDKFDKNQFTKDLYMIDTYIGQMKYTRNTFFKLSKSLKWYGVIHEFIMSDEKNLTSGLAENISVNVSMDGASWQGKTSDKYLSHAHTLEKYISDNRQDPRWIFYTAQSYHDSATSENMEENDERLRRALRYYKERTDRSDGYAEEIYYSHFRIGTLMRSLESPWNLNLQQCLKAYSVDPSRGESIKTIIDYYLQMSEWHLAYLYTKFAYENFHNKNPYPNRLLFVDEALYLWRFAESHAASSFYCGKLDEAKKAYKSILDAVKAYPKSFTEEDLNKIKMNAQFLQ